MTLSRSLFVRLVAIWAGTVLVINLLFAQLNHQKTVTGHQLQLPSGAEHQFPSASSTRALLLDFETLGADLAWVWSLVYWGEHRTNVAPPKYLEDNAETVAALDPKFYPVYDWFSTTYIQSHLPPSHEEIERVNAFLEQGMNQFPTDYRLPYSAGMNQIGYSEHRTARERLEELSRGIEYLQRASRLSGAPPDLPLTVSWMYQRRRQVRAKLEGASGSSTNGSVSRQKVEFLAEIYYAIDDPGTRRSIRRILSQSDRGKKLLANYQQQYQRTLKQRRLASFPYLPLETWSAVATETP
jgi:hypothetical protein